MIFGGLNRFTLIDYPEKVAAVVYTVGCNFRCPYCHNPELVNETVGRLYSKTTVLSFLNTRCGMLDGLVITGGEPTIHGISLLMFMRQVKDLGFLIKLDTNGTNPNFIMTAVREKLVDYIAMDIKAPLNHYQSVAGRPVDIRAIQTSIDFIKSSPVEYEFRTTVVKALLSPDDLEKMASEIAGAKRYYLQRFVPTHILNPQLKRKVLYSDDEFVGFQKVAGQYVIYCGIR